VDDVIFLSLHTVARGDAKIACTQNDSTRGSSGVTSHRQPRQCRGAQGPKTVKGAQSDPNYVSRLLARSECLPGGTIVTPLRGSGIWHRGECSNWLTRGQHRTGGGVWYLRLPCCSLGAFRTHFVVRFLVSLPVLWPVLQALTDRFRTTWIITKQSLASTLYGARLLGLVPCG